MLVCKRIIWLGEYLTSWKSIETQDGSLQWLAVTFDSREQNDYFSLKSFNNFPPMFINDQISGTPFSSG